MTSDEARAYLFPLSSYDIAEYTGLEPASIRAYLNQEKVPESFRIKIEDLDVPSMIRNIPELRRKYVNLMDSWEEKARLSRAFRERVGV